MRCIVVKKNSFVGNLILFLCWHMDGINTSKDGVSKITDSFMLLYDNDNCKEDFRFQSLESKAFSFYQSQLFNHDAFEQVIIVKHSLLIVYFSRWYYIVKQNKNALLWLYCWFYHLYSTQCNSYMCHLLTSSSYDCLIIPVVSFCIKYLQVLLRVHDCQNSK